MDCGFLRINLRHFAAATLFLVSGMLVACASKPADSAACAQVDWYEIGRHDGAQGSAVNHTHLMERDCAKTLTPEAESVYSNGRNAGLVEFCDPKNAYELGRMGATYYYVCPSTVEPDFLASYRKGQSAHELEIQNQQLDQQINEIDQKLAQSGTGDEQQDLEEKLENLKDQRAKIEQQLTKIISD